MRLAIWANGATALLVSALQPFLQKPFIMDDNSPDPSAHGDLNSLMVPDGVPGGTSLSLCEVSRATDLFQIGAVEMTKQPVYFDDDFEFHLYGNFQEAFRPNVTLDLRIDCGSHCQDYGNPPGETPSVTWWMDFCKVSFLQQPRGPDGKLGNYTCSPGHGGLGMITSLVYVFPMFIRTPGWYNFTFDARTSEGNRIYCLTTEVCLRWEDPENNKGYPEVLGLTVRGQGKRVTTAWPDGCKPGHRTLEGQ